MKRREVKSEFYNSLDFIFGVIVTACLAIIFVSWSEHSNNLREYMALEDSKDPASLLFVFNSFYIPDYSSNIFFEKNINNDHISIIKVTKSLDNLLKKEKQVDLSTSVTSTSLNSNKEKNIIIKGKLKAGETLYSCLKRYNLSTTVISNIIYALKKMINVRKLKPGEKFEIGLTKNGDFIFLRWIKSEFDIYRVYVCNDKKETYEILKEEVQLEKRIVKASGKITGGLIDSFLSYGLKAKLARDFAEIFSTKIDFNTDIKIGDKFKIIYEEYTKNNKFVGLGKILAAQYCFGDGPCISAFYFKGKNMAQGNYFTSDGKLLSDSFLRSPLKVYRLTSGFNPKRYHPILKVFRPHYGVDLAAPIGTPVMAVADGIVSFTGWQRGYGRIVILKHSGGYKTYYGHLSRFAKGIKKGVKVKQRQIIGYVGRSGYATGPHLDYRVKKDGRFINPFRAKFEMAQDLIKNKKKFIEMTKFFQHIMDNSSINGIVSVKKEVVKGKPQGLVG